MTNEETAIRDFEAFMRDKVPPYGNLTIEADGNIHRYRVEGDRAGSRNGAYVLHTDERPAGYVKNWKTGDGYKWQYEFNADEKREYAQSQNDPVQRAKAEADRRERDRRKAEELKRQEQKAQAMALKEYLNAWPITDPLTEHPYLKSKFDGLNLSYPDDGQFRTRYGGTSDNVDYNVITNYPPKVCRGTIEGGICKAGELLVPTRNISTGAFNGLIRITDKPDAEGHWAKLNYKGISPTGAAFIIRPENAKSEAVYVCEGFGTAIAIMVDLPEYIVMAAGSCHNLSHVCKALRTRLGNMKIIIVADNDKNGKGIVAAEECVKAKIADTYIKSATNGFDWCDDLVARLKTKKGAK